MAKTAAQKNREMRQNSLRELIRSQGHERYVVENIYKIEELASIEDPEGSNVRTAQINGLKVANEQRLRLLNKYLPDVKAVTGTVDFQFDETTPGSQVTSIMRAAAKGEIPPDIALMFANAVKASVDIEAATDLKERLEKLEALLSERTSEED